MPCIIARALSIRALFGSLATPFRCDTYGTAFSKKISLSRRKLQRASSRVRRDSSNVSVSLYRRLSLNVWFKVTYALINIRLTFEGVDERLASIVVDRKHVESAKKLTGTRPQTSVGTSCWRPSTRCDFLRGLNVCVVIFPMSHPILSFMVYEFCSFGHRFSFHYWLPVEYHRITDVLDGDAIRRFWGISYLCLQISLQPFGHSVPLLSSCSCAPYASVWAPCCPIQPCTWRNPFIRTSCHSRIPPLEWLKFDWR